MITRYKICFNNNSKVYFETGIKSDKKLIEKLEEKVSKEKFIYKWCRRKCMIKEKESPKNWLINDTFYFVTIF